MQLVEDADGGGRRLLELIKRRLSSVDELAAVRLVASIDVALMVDGDDVRAENERLRAAAEDAAREIARRLSVGGGGGEGEGEGEDEGGAFGGPSRTYRPRRARGRRGRVIRASDASE